jgi:hypothetical protein
MLAVPANVAMEAVGRAKEITDRFKSAGSN